MNDRKGLAVLVNSPSFLLRELGLEEEVFLFRPRGDPWGKAVPLRDLDEDIQHRGLAYLMRLQRDLVGEIVEGRLLCLQHQRKVLKLVTLQYMHRTGKFEFGVCRGQSRDSREIQVSQLWRNYLQRGYTLLPFRESPLLYP